MLNVLIFLAEFWEFEINSDWIITQHSDYAELISTSLKTLKNVSCVQNQNSGVVYKKRQLNIIDNSSTFFVFQ